jgi:hypothetical protein
VITGADIVTRVKEWGLREDVVEKDYVLGWVLWGIGADTELETRWAFKGGTCLKKCYIETYRFSEDLDFTVLPGPTMTETAVTAALARVIARVGEASGIDFSVRPPALRMRPDGASLEGRIYYRGPRAAPGEASIKIDLSLAETMARPPVLRPISHPYPDALPIQTLSQSRRRYAATHSTNSLPRSSEPWGSGAARVTCTTSSTSTGGAISDRTDR